MPKTKYNVVSNSGPFFLPQTPPPHTHNAYERWVGAWGENRRRISTRSLTSIDYIVCVYARRLSKLLASAFARPTVDAWCCTAAGALYCWLITDAGGDGWLVEEDARGCLRLYRVSKCRGGVALCCSGICIYIYIYI